MNPLLFVFAAVVAFVAGVWLAVLLVHWTKRASFRKKCGRIFVAVAVLCWAGVAWAVLDWYWSVEPRLGQDVGAGIGFGWMLVHFVAPLASLATTGLAVGFRFGPKVRQTTRLDKKSNKTQHHKSDRAGDWGG